MKRWHLVCLMVIAGGAIVLGQSATADNRGGRDNSIWARLIGLQEVPVVLTAGRAWFRADIADDELSIDWSLTYEQLQADVTQAHLHIGQPNVNGGISVWMCATPPTAPPAPPAPQVPLPQTCPARSGTISGKWTAADVGGPVGQGVAAQEFAELVRAIRIGVVYANIHTTNSPGGEIRGQVHH
jgi:CHRD domain-containing protein